MFKRFFITLKISGTYSLVIFFLNVFKACKFKIYKFYVSKNIIHNIYF